MEYLHGPTPETNNTDLAAALATLGIPFCRDHPFRVITGDRDQLSYFFEPRSVDLQHLTGPLIHAWDDIAWQTANPHHPLCYMRAALLSRHRLIGYGKGACRLAIAKRPGGKLEAIRIKHTPGPDCLRAAPGRIPDPATNPALQTTDINLAASLLALGIPLYSHLPVQRSDGVLTFFFRPASLCGTHHTAAMMLAWDTPAWPEKNPEHPFAYCSYAFRNRKILLRELMRSRPLVCIMHHDLPSFLTRGAPPAMEKSFLSELAKI